MDHGGELPFELDGIGALLAGTANVIMQLAVPPIGYGVLESKVESGQIIRHPLKRFRTTFTYISVALLGTDEERARYRHAVNGAHRLVHSDASSPVPYNAFDRELQLWVAACLYYGAADLHEKLHGPMTEAQADAFYAAAARLGTTLQVPAEMWPPNRVAFARYWDAQLARVSIDEPVRRYLLDLITREHMPAVLRGSARFNVWVTTGFLPQRFRDEMRLPWAPDDQRRFEQFLRGIGAIQRLLPGAVRSFPFNWLLYDLRVRTAFGLPLV